MQDAVDPFYSMLDLSPESGYPVDLSAGGGDDLYVGWVRMYAWFSTGPTAPIAEGPRLGRRGFRFETRERAGASGDQFEQSNERP